MTVKALESTTKTTTIQPLKTLSTTDKKVANCRTKISDLIQGVVSSRVFAAVAVSAVAVAVLFFLVSNPTGWLIAAVATGAFFTALLLPTGNTKQMLEFEFSAVTRACKKKNYHEIAIGRTSAKLILGAIPNRLISDGEHLVNDKKVGAVLSINEPWEREQLGLSLPYQDEDWKKLGVDYMKLDEHDHKLLSNESLDRTADFIYKNIKEGKNVYVHCRAGVGRSAMAIAAYLIKYEYRTAEQAAEIVKNSRPCSTIKKKLKGLKSYELYVQQRNLEMPKRMEEMTKLVEDLDAYSDRNELEQAKKSEDLKQFVAYQLDVNPDPLY